MALIGLAVASPAAADRPSWLERWLFNSAERTARAIESFERGDVAAGVEPLETALRLAGEDPRVQYNAAAARLAAGRGDARSLLETAAESVGGELLPLVRYNLGNARWAGNDLAGAIEAYEQALRHDPELDDAKHNLELARRRLEEQERQARPPEQEQQRPEQQRRRDQEPRDSEPRDSQTRERPGEPSQESGSEEPERGERRESPLPRFRDLPDMTAEEAAAILQAVENMEREQRRRDAVESARRRRAGGKDW